MKVFILIICALAAISAIQGGDFFDDVNLEPCQLDEDGLPQNQTCVVELFKSGKIQLTYFSTFWVPNPRAGCS